MASRLISETPAFYGRDTHPIARQGIDEDAIKIMQRLTRAGFKGYLVGGGVRDLLLGKTPKDFDIATDATPRQVKSLFGNSRIIGRRFKLVHVFFRGSKIIQISTFRDFSDESEGSESATSMPETDNKYGNEVTDAHRRDLTINGLFYDLASDSVIDYVGGIKDLENKIVRIIGDPDQRFAEDPVRMVRAVRHAARARFTLDMECRRSIQRNKALLLTCSTMRVYEELKKDLGSGSCLAILRLLAETELLELLLPELVVHNSFLLSPQSSFAAALERIDSMIKGGIEIPATVVLALIALFVETQPSAEYSGKPAVRDLESLHEHLKRCFSRLAVPKREREKIEEILGWWYRIECERDRVRIAVLSRQECLGELQILASIMADGVSESVVLETIGEALAYAANPSRQGDEGGERRRRRRRRPRRRGRGADGTLSSPETPQ